jgi:hypothetical protein
MTLESNHNSSYQVQRQSLLNQLLKIDVNWRIPLKIFWKLCRVSAPSYIYIYIKHIKHWYFKSFHNYSRALEKIKWFKHNLIEICRMELMICKCNKQLLSFYHDHTMINVDNTHVTNNLLICNLRNIVNELARVTKSPI